MGDVGIEHRIVFIGGWGPSYTLIKQQILYKKLHTVYHSKN